MARKGVGKGTLIAMLAVVGLITLGGGYVLFSPGGLQVPTAQAIAGIPATGTVATGAAGVGNVAPAQPGGSPGVIEVQNRVCDGSEVRVNAFDKYAGTIISEGGVDMNVLEGGTLKYRGYSGTSASNTVDVPNDVWISLWSGGGAGTAYNYEYITGRNVDSEPARNDPSQGGYYTDCEDPVSYDVDFTRQGTLTHTIEFKGLQQQNTDYAHAETAVNIADIDNPSTQYTWTIVSSQGTQYGAFGSTTSPNVVVATVDYNAADFALVEIPNSISISGVPTHVSNIRDANATAQKAFGLPFLKDAATGDVSWTIRMKTSADSTIWDGTDYTRKFTIHLSDEQPFYNVTSQRVEFLTEDPQNGADIGATDNNAMVVYR